MSAEQRMGRSSTCLCTSPHRIERSPLTGDTLTHKTTWLPSSTPLRKDPVHDFQRTESLVNDRDIEKALCAVARPMDDRDWDARSESRPASSNTPGRTRTCSTDRTPGCYPNHTRS